MILSDAERGKVIDKAVFAGLQGGPHKHTATAIAVALGEALRLDFKTYAHRIVENAAVLATELQERGFDLVSGGTDNHARFPGGFFEGGVCGLKAASEKSSQLGARAPRRRGRRAGRRGRTSRRQCTQASAS
jgi:hypothetical protein